MGKRREIKRKREYGKPTTTPPGNNTSLRKLFLFPAAFFFFFFLSYSSSARLNSPSARRCAGCSHDGLCVIDPSHLLFSLGVMTAMIPLFHFRSIRCRRYDPTESSIEQRQKVPRHGAGRSVPPASRVTRMKKTCRLFHVFSSCCLPRGA